MQQALRPPFPKDVKPTASFKTLLHPQAIANHVGHVTTILQMEPSISAASSSSKENFARLQEEHAKVGHSQLLLIHDLH